MLLSFQLDPLKIDFQAKQDALQESRSSLLSRESFWIWPHAGLNGPKSPQKTLVCSTPLMSRKDRMIRLIISANVRKYILPQFLVGGMAKEN